MAPTQETNQQPQKHSRSIIHIVRAGFLSLPISFYLALAIICALLLGRSGFTDLYNPKQLALTLTMFVIFFGAVIYRSVVDAIEIARNYQKENDSLMQNVFTRDDFASDLGKRVAKEEKDTDQTGQ